MAVLLCDICEGKIVIKTGGVAVCEVCGMEHSKERIQEKIRETRSNSDSTTNVTEPNAVLIPQNTIDTLGSVVAHSALGNQNTIDKLLAMAVNAKSSFNNAEAETYANRILELDPTHWQAWMIKGSAAGWQSTLRTIRLLETAQCFSKSLEYVSANEIEELNEALLDDFQKIALAIIQLRANHFKDYPIEMEDYKSTIQEVVAVTDIFNTTTKIKTPKLKDEIAAIINLSCVECWNDKIHTEYVGSDGRPNRYQFQTFIERTQYCMNLIEFAINLKDLNSADIIRLNNLISMNQSCITACSWKWQYGKFGSYYDKEYSLTHEAIQVRKSNNQLYKQTIEQIQIDEENRKIANAISAEKLRITQNEAFWHLHTEQKEKAEQELERLGILLEQAIADFTLNEQKFIQQRISKIESLLLKDYHPDDELPNKLLEVLNSITTWNKNHEGIRTSSLIKTRERIIKRDAIKKQIIEQDIIISQNKGFFGETARIRKEAQKNKETLQTRLKAYDDLGA